MDINFTSDSALAQFAGIAALVLLTVIPVKISATIFNAPNSKLSSCAIAVVLGTVAAIACIAIIQGFIGLVAAYVVVSAIYWKTLQISFVWSFLFTFGVLFVQIGILQALSKLAIISIT